MKVITLNWLCVMFAFVKSQISDSYNFFLHFMTDWWRGFKSQLISGIIYVFNNLDALSLTDACYLVQLVQSFGTLSNFILGWGGGKINVSWLRDGARKRMTDELFWVTGGSYYYFYFILFYLFTPSPSLNSWYICI